LNSHCRYLSRAKNGEYVVNIKLVLYVDFPIAWWFVAFGWFSRDHVFGLFVECVPRDKLSTFALADSQTTFSNQ
jgi:hypothetical protein